MGRAASGHGVPCSRLLLCLEGDGPGSLGLPPRQEAPIFLSVNGTEPRPCREVERMGGVDHFLERPQGALGRAQLRCLGTGPHSLGDGRLTSSPHNELSGCPQAVTPVLTC